MVGREVLLRVAKTPAQPSEPLLEVEDLQVDRRPRDREGPRRLVRACARARSSASPGIDGNGQTELIDAMTGLRGVDVGHACASTGDDVTQRAAHGHLEAGLGHIPEDRQRRGLVLEFSIAENIALHDYRAPPASRFGWLFPRRLIERARTLIKEFDVRGGGPKTRAGGLSGGNQQKVVLAREIERDPKVLIAAQPTRGLDVGAIEFVHRRLIEERDEGRAILLVSLELEEVLSLSDRILVMYEGEIVGEFPPTATRGGARHRDDRRRAQRGGRVSDAGRDPARPAVRAARRAAGRAAGELRSADRARAARRRARRAAPHGADRLRDRRARRARHDGQEPARDVQGDLRGLGPQLVLPVGHRRRARPRRRSTSSRRCIATTTLILVGLAVAFAFRCGLFNIGGQGQYLSGAILAVWIGSSFDGLSPCPARAARDRRRRRAPGAASAGIAGFLKATVGAHEVISTIMLNWIVIWVGVVPVRPRRPAAERHAGVRPDLERRPREREAPVWWGDPLLQGLHIGFFIAIGALVVYWIILNRTTLGYGVKAVGFNPEAARYGGISVARNYFLAMAISGAFAGLAGALDILGWQFRLSTGDIQASTIGFVGIAVALLGRNTAVGVGPRGAALRRACSPARRRATSTRRSSSPSSRRT